MIHLLSGVCQRAGTTARSGTGGVHRSPDQLYNDSSAWAAFSAGHPASRRD